MPSVEILNLGDELLLGLRSNSHLVYLGEMLTRHQLAPRWASVIRDDHSDLVEAVAYARERQGTAARSGAFYASGVTTDQIASGMSWWLDATQALPPA